MSNTVLQPEFLDRLKSQLTANPYTDEQLNNVAFFYITPTMTMAGEIGAGDSSPAAILTLCNLFAGGNLADFINAGCISVSAVDRYMKKVAAEYDAEQEGKGVDELPTDGDN